MQRLFLFAVVLLCLAVSAFAVPNAAQAFHSFKSAFNKQYDDPTEEVRRFEIFQQNIILAEQWNKEHNTNAFGINSPFADMTQEEFQSKYLMNEEKFAAEVADFPWKVKSFPPSGEQFPPPVGSISIWDWANVKPGSVSAVKNQGQCGSCWAFAATETLESAAFIQGRGTFVLSPQQLVDCTYANYNGCNGGWYGTAWQYLQGTNGQAANAQYPYTSGNTQTSGGCQYNNGWGLVRPSSIVPIATSETGIWNYLLNTAPVTVSVDASYWYLYNGNNAIFPASQCTGGIDHAVVVTGVANINGTWNWRIRNSWDTWWGNQGYIYLPIGSNACSIANYPLSVTV